MSDQYKVTQIHAGSALWFVEDATGGVVAFCYSKDRATLVVHALDAYTSGSDVTETDHNAETAVMSTPVVMESCEFCGSTDRERDGQIETQDMGEGRSMRLCGRCREYIAAGNREFRRRQALGEYGN